MVRVAVGHEVMVTRNLPWWRIEVGDDAIARCLSLKAPSTINSLAVDRPSRVAAHRNVECRILCFEGLYHQAQLRSEDEDVLQDSRLRNEVHALSQTNDAQHLLRHPLRSSIVCVWGLGRDQRYAQYPREPSHLVLSHFTAKIVTNLSRQRQASVWTHRRAADVDSRAYEQPTWCLLQLCLYELQLSRMIETANLRCVSQHATMPEVWDRRQYLAVKMVVDVDLSHV